MKIWYILILCIIFAGCIPDSNQTINYTKRRNRLFRTRQPWSLTEKQHQRYDSLNDLDLYQPYKYRRYNPLSDLETHKPLNSYQRYNPLDDLESSRPSSGYRRYNPLDDL